jgi:hypothetical protein
VEPPMHAEAGRWRWWAVLLLTVAGRAPRYLLLVDRPEPLVAPGDVGPDTPATSRSSHHTAALAEQADALVDRYKVTLLLLPAKVHPGMMIAGAGDLEMRAFTQNGRSAPNALVKLDRTSATVRQVAPSAPKAAATRS